MARYEVIIDGCRQLADATWKECMRLVIRYPDKDWEINEIGERIEVTVTTHRAIPSEMVIQ